MSSLTEQLREVTLADVDRGPRPTARLGPYAIWQARDYLRGAGGATVVLSGLAIVMLTTVALPGGPHSPAEQAATTTLLGIMAFLGPIFACSGLVSDDRSRGYYRFLLAKPVNPVRFYAQAFLVRGAVFLGITAAAWTICAALVGAGSFVGSMSYAALCFLTVGGLTLLLSSMSKHAWLATLVLSAAAGLASQLTRVRTAWHPLFMALHAVLPPVHLLSGLAGRLMLGDFMANLVGSLAWFAGYGLVALAAALTVIRGREWPL
jgi:hypothetical protein